MSNHDFYDKNEQLSRNIIKILNDNTQVSPHVSKRLEQARNNALKHMRKQEKVSIFDRFLERLLPDLKLIVPATALASALLIAVSFVVSENEIVFNENISNIVAHAEDGIDYEKDLMDVLDEEEV